MKKSTFCVAIAQMRSALGDVSKNLEKVERCIAAAAKKGAQLVCFPELCLTGYNLDILKDDILTLSRAHYEEADERLRRAAKQAGIYVIAPYGTVKDDRRVYNSAVVYAPDGSVAGDFQKVHAFLSEKHYFPQGSAFPVFETPYCKIGIMICYDAGFPESARELAKNGAEVIFIPAAWRIEDERSWLLNVPSRALENQLFTVGVNRVGQEGSLHLFGKSMACDPYGNTLVELPADEEHMETVLIDLSLVAKCRADGGYLKDIGILKSND